MSFACGLFAAPENLIDSTESRHVQNRISDEHWFAVFVSEVVLDLIAVFIFGDVATETDQVRHPHQPTKGRVAPVIASASLVAFLVPFAADLRN